jgi:hypothetical protein
MAALTDDEWAAIRAGWEADPRQGLKWLTTAGGGRWPVTEASRTTSGARWTSTASCSPSWEVRRANSDGIVN